jgi:hypothetical protein
LGVVRDPREPTPVGQAHGLVLAKKTGAQKTGLLRASEWTVAPAGACARPAG